MRSWASLAACKALAHRLPLGVLEVVGLGTMLLRLRAKRGDGLAECQELPCGLAHPRHEDAALPPAAAAKTSHALVQLWLETVGLTRQSRGSVAAGVRDARDALQRFFCAFYRVVASGTRWLPGSQR